MPDLVVKCVGRRWLKVEKQDKNVVIHVMWKLKRLATLVLEKNEATQLIGHIDKALRMRGPRA